MRIAILISAGRHPVSGKPALPRLEAQAIRMASGLGETFGLHAGPDTAPLEAALGKGLSRGEQILVDAAADPVDALAERLSRSAPDIVLAGRRGQGGDETGLLPYGLAARLGLTLVCDVVAVRKREDGLLEVDQALPKGALRRLVVRPPVLLTVHPNAPAPPPFAFGKARRGTVERVGTAAHDIAVAGLAVEERPYRKRPRMMRATPAGGSAADRLKAVTGEASSGGAQVMVQPSPEEAAREVLAFLRRVGVLAPANVPAKDN